MPVRYSVKIRDHLGVVQAELDAWRTLTIQHQLNHFSTLDLTLSTKDPRTPLFNTVDMLVEVIRYDPTGNPWNIPLYTEYIGFHRTIQKQQTDKGDQTTTSKGRGLVDLLNRANILYFNGSHAADKSDYADRAMAFYANENGGPNSVSVASPIFVPGLGNTTEFDNRFVAITPARYQVVIPPVNTSIALWSGQKSKQNLLRTIKEIGTAANVDFDMIWGGPTNPTLFTFETFWPQRGVNRTVGNGVVLPVVFSTAFGNMLTPVYINSREEEHNVIIVTGQGDGDHMQFAVTTGATIADSPWNQIEACYDDRSETQLIGLQLFGQGQLQNLQANETVTFKVLQTPQYQYGRDYRVGDLVTLQYEEHQLTKKITGAKITVAEGKETIDLTFGEAVVCS